MISTVIHCYISAFSGAVEGVALKKLFSGQTYIPSSFSLSSSSIILFCAPRQWVYASPISVALEASGKFVNSSLL